MEEWVEWLEFLTLEILSAILLTLVLIHSALMPTSDPIKRPQKNLAKARPIIDFLQIRIVHFLALILSVTQSTTRWGLSVILLSRKAVKDAQLLMIIVTYSRRFMEMNVLSSLFLRWSKVHWTILLGKGKYHQSSRSVEYSPEEREELSPIKNAAGVFEQWMPFWLSLPMVGEELL